MYNVHITCIVVFSLHSAQYVQICNLLNYFENLAIKNITILHTLFLFITKERLPHMIHVRPTYVLYNFPLRVILFDTFDVYITNVL